ncbi:XAC2610-related protein [Aliikangiella sp. IMCC44359]|uniref:XAC2610-related protein n=1 Tax=Aliikangiella sp. IMCC44359 TaxID=3459125 RepID=UPI00403AB3B9
MKKIFFLTFILILTSNIHAETKLSSHKNVFPFKYSPTPALELTLTKKDNVIKVTYPEGNTEEITTLETKNWNGNYNITQDLNFDGYVDLGLWVSVNPRGLNESYDIILWDENTRKLKKVANIINPEIESNFLIENIIDTSSICPNEDFLCAHSNRYRWKNDSLVIHSTLIPEKNNHTTIKFYKNERIVKTVTVPNKQIKTKIEKWDLAN